ncbi:5-hydroxytryptamine receptor 2A [Exaiptasia diaphana]|uniref:G-protein coupled receptors family 1 profile domain-containing protein n=1 Tax=Exaiptasia diaphana TaxID=2652724 RepID=A0A913XMZ7_EXADI|nr:5-hydroxytryptamine receptor 2A [Exaiptasia diaphana]
MNSSTCNVSLGNSSCLSAVVLPPWYQNGYSVTMFVLYIVVILAALVGNILVCTAVYINPHLRHNVASYFIVSLAISDIGTASFSMPFDAEAFTTYRRWYHGEVLCIVWTTAYLFTVPSSIWNLFIMSIDRYKTLKNPWNRFKESHSMTSRRANITIIVLWVYCLVIALLPVTGWRFKAYPRSVINNYCAFNISKYFSLVGSFVNFYLPMFAMCGIYYKVYRIARAHRKFPLALETRFHKVSTNESQTASTQFPGDSMNVGRPSIDQQQSHDLENKQGNDTVGLENVSFCFEENNCSSSGRDFGARKDSPRNAILSRGKCTKDKGQVTDKLAHGYSESSLNMDEQYCSEEFVSAKHFHPRYKRKSYGQHDKRKTNQDCIAQKLECDDTTLAESDAKCTVNEAKATFIMSNERASAVEGRLNCLEKDESHVRKSGLEKSHNDNTCMEDDAKTNHADSSEKRKHHNTPTKSKIDFNARKNKDRHFPLEKKLKHESPYPNEEGCSLKKFRQKSDEDASPLPATITEVTEGKKNDTITSSNKRRMKHFAVNTKAARTISIIVSAFLGCWMPFTTLSVTFNFCGAPCWKIKGIDICTDVLLLLGYVNSAINPVLFSYQNMNFRKSYRQIAHFFLQCFKVCKDD